MSRPLELLRGGTRVTEGWGGPPGAHRGSGAEGVRKRVRIVEVKPSELIVLGCRGCGAKIVLFGREEDWRGEGRLTFRCAGCGGEVGLDERAEEDEEAAAAEEDGEVGRLVRKLKPGGN